MVDFRPFHGLLPDLSRNEDILDRVSPPYDIISPEELKRLRSKPYNITNVTLGGVDGKYDDASATLDSWISSGKLASDEKECYYIYRQSFQDNGQWFQRNGIIGILKAENYEAGNIIPHEETFPKIKEDRLNLLRATSTHCESIFGLYDRSDIDVNEIAKRSPKLFECTDLSRTVHQLFRVSDRTVVDTITRMMSNKKILIADGHHRYETSYKYSQENMLDERRAYVLCTMVSSQDSGMFVRPTHRLIQNLKVQEKDLLDALGKYLTIRQMKDVQSTTEAMAKATIPTFGFLFPSGRTYVGEYTAPPGDILWSIDTYVCQEVIMKSVLYAFPFGNELTVDYDHDIGSINSKIAAGQTSLADPCPCANA